VSVQPFVETEYIAQLELGSRVRILHLFHDSRFLPTTKEKAGWKHAGLLRLKWLLSVSAQAASLFVRDLQVGIGTG
jgi:hypothetical protein